MEDTRSKWARRMAILTAIGMFIVLLMGAQVTATGSADGCGNDWPLCHGSWLPENTYKSITEYSHRIVTGIEGFAVLATAILAWPLRKRHPEFNVLVPLVGGTLILQSLMGAAAVKWPTSAEVLATHFGISLVCLASSALIALILIDARHGTDTHRTIPAGRERQFSRFRWLMLVTFVFAIVVVYSGAYVRHTGTELACTSWPTCTGEIIPNLDLSTPQGIHSVHRLLAGVIGLMIVAIAAIGYGLRSARRDLWLLAGLALVNVAAQMLAGRWVVYSGLTLLATLAHAALMSTLFVTLAEGVRRTWVTRPTSEPAGIAVSTDDVYPGSEGLSRAPSNG